MPELVAFPPWPASIHAPARGATLRHNLLHELLLASIHAPARGATHRPPQPYSGIQLQSTLPHRERPLAEMLGELLPELQSTLPHGERLAQAPRLHGALAASIHASARGATRESMTASCCVMALQSTLPHGERRPKTCGYMTCCRLQSTLPHGKRPFWDEQYREETQASIHAPARGATIRLGCCCKYFRASIHAPARGATPAKGRGPGMVRGFNPRSRTGSDNRGTITSTGC